MKNLPVSPANWAVSVVVEPENPDLPRFSASQTRKFLQCPAAWWYSRRHPRTSSKPAALGNEVHARLERWQEGKPDFPDDKPLCDDPEVVQHLDNDALRRAEVMARAAREAFPGPAGNVTPEREFFITVTIGKAKFQLSGFIDTEILHEDSAEIKDLKTTGNFKYALNSAQLAADVQAVIYAAATFATHPDIVAVDAQWVYVHSKNKRKMLGPQPHHQFGRGEVDLLLRGFFDAAWGPMLKVGQRATAPKGKVPTACTQYHWGCDFDAANGGPCNQHARVPASMQLLIGIVD